MRNVLQQLRRFIAWMFSIAALIAVFVVYGYARAIFSFADCGDGSHPDTSLGGLVAFGFGMTVCTGGRLSAVADKAEPAAVTASPAPTLYVRSSPGYEAAATQQAAEAARGATDQTPPATVDAPATFHGFVCEEATCSGHQRGYDWAEEKGIDDPHSCYHGARLSNPRYRSFSEGCEAYVDDSTGDARLDPSERYSDEDSDSENGQ